MSDWSKCCCCEQLWKSPSVVCLMPEHPHAEHSYLRAQDPRDTGRRLSGRKGSQERWQKAFWAFWLYPQPEASSVIENCITVSSTSPYPSKILFRLLYKSVWIKFDFVFIQRCCLSSSHTAQKKHSLPPSPVIIIQFFLDEMSVELKCQAQFQFS